MQVRVRQLLLHVAIHNFLNITLNFVLKGSGSNSVTSQQVCIHWTEILL